MKSIMLNIDQKICDRIVSGEQTLLIRKTIPIIPTPFKCYMYCPKDNTSFLLPIGSEVRLTDSDIWRNENDNVIGEFICNKTSKYKSIFAVNPNEYEEISEISFKKHPRKICSNECIPNVRRYLQTTISKNSCLTYNELKEYIGTGFNIFYGLDISNLIIYGKPKKLNDFYSVCKAEGMSDDKRCINCPHLCFDNDPVNGYTRWCGVNKRKPLMEPPRPWFYAIPIKEE